ncbi:MAG: strawberry notch C-terminal domain-containing protein [Flavobacteriales bacterium]|nr:strawberry notch C-terminal domain-containing protein [Flavobacteriales bacterium]
MSKSREHIISKAEREFVNQIKEALLKEQKLSRPRTESIAKSFGIIDKTKVKELTELAIVEVARSISLSNDSPFDKYQNIVDLYSIQTNLSFRTSMSVLLQQYSTPAPIGYLMGLYCGIDDGEKTLFEPSAGNGLLTIATRPSKVTVNEIDPIRRRNLKSQGYNGTYALDVSQEFHRFARKFDAVITNPPFGRLIKAANHNGFLIRELDHHMAILALQTMKTNGRAAIIVGGHTVWDERGRVQKGKNRIFFNYLYKHYNVDDVILIDGSSLYSRQGTSFNTRLILINGVNKQQKGVAPLKTTDQATVVKSFDELYNRISMHFPNKNNTLSKLEIEALELESQLLAQELGAPYVPASDSCVILDTQVPDAMEFEMHQAISRIKEDVGGDIDNFVRHRLGYNTKAELCRSLSAEQIDAVGMAVYNIEALNQAVIIGDQTGIGKGRVAASIIRYAVHQGIMPIFLTEKANLFSDIYRDLSAIGSAHLKPLIVNARASKTQIKDENGNVVYEALSKPEQDQIFEDRKIPSEYDFVVATYSQFNSPQKKPQKPQFLLSIAKNSIIIMDESHNSSGSSNTGIFMQGVLARTSGAVFLSATFAKRPDNMPIYAMKTAISEANMSKEDLVDSINKGGVALQEVLASQLVAEGQMIRRERTYEGIEVNYITLTDKANEHKAIADNITNIVRDIIAFQTNHIDNRVDELDEIAAAEGKEVDLREGTNQAGVDNQPYFSKVFNVINQMLFSIKAEAVAEKAIARLKEGKKPIIAFASTMGSFIEQMEDQNGMPVNHGDTVKADFSIVLEKGLEGVMRYTVTEPDGSKSYAKFDIAELSIDAQEEYFRISENIKKIATGITISPIDVIIQKIQKAGYSVAEVTGRKLQLQLNLQSGMGVIEPRKKVNTNDAFREFNNNEVDVLLINQSGSTGASAHAIVTDKVSADEVRQRVMIVLQPELDINTEVQKRGRINRTGQILKPIYDYVNSAIPAEQRLMMMLQKKLKSLDANTSSNQKQSNSILDVPDFLNKYGDKVVVEYLMENPEVNELLGDPLKLGTGNEIKDGAAHKVSGRVAVLSTQMQEDFYKDIKDRYDTMVEYLKQSGDYDLEVEQLDLQAEVISSTIIKIGKGGNSSFGEDSILEKVYANVLKKPFKAEEMKNMVLQSLEGRTAEDIMDRMIDDYERFMAEKLQLTINEISDKYRSLINNVPSEKKVIKLLDSDPQAAQRLIEERTAELRQAQDKRLRDEEKVTANKKQYIRGLFKYFKIGKRLLYPVPSFDGTTQNQLAVFLGFQIDKKRNNPYAPSAIKLKFAIASSQKYLAIPASYGKDINAIKGASVGNYDTRLEDLAKEWEETILEDSKDRSIRYIVTGNILQAFSDFKGKLVSYTTNKNEVKKGILMPEHWSPDTETKGRVIVPIAKAFKIIRSMTNGAATYGSHNLAIFKMYDGSFRVSVPASRKKGADIYLNESLLKLVRSNNFEKVGDQMTSYVEENDLEAFLNVLQEQLGVTTSLNQSQIDSVGLTVTKVKRRAKITPPPPEKELKIDARLLELEAEALELELELLSF